MRSVVQLVLLMAAPLFISNAYSASLDEVAELSEAGRHQQALEALDGLGSAATSRYGRLLKANALAGLNRDKEAERVYRELIAEQPQDPKPYNNLAALYADAGDLDEASKLLTQAMSSDARYAAVYKNLSRVYVEMSRKSYAKALRLNEKPQGPKLVSLDHRADPPKPVARPKSSGVKPAAAKTQLVPLDSDKAIEALKAWAAAWSSQNVEAYLGAYADDYRPPQGLSLESWQTQRAVRLKKPDAIEVVLSDFTSSPTARDEVTVTAKQRYRSDRYQDMTRKGFVLKKSEQGWKIRREYTIEVLK